MTRARRAPAKGVFNTRERIRLGVWGLGRGEAFYKACASLHLDVVAGCDFNAHMRGRFRAACPRAFVTDNAEEFLAQDFDAVLLATFCPAHADDAIACLNAGKHVLSEVTAFHTLAEGVRLVEAVEQSGRIYNLAENYPFTAAQMFVAQQWREGRFGELQYAEGEYVHDVRWLAYQYIDRAPIQPGHTIHAWRSWLHYHYYCTHSLGPIMHVTGTRPVRVVALPGAVEQSAYPRVEGGGLAVVAPSLITMDNGGVVRNLMGGTANDTHQFRYWGTRGGAEVGWDDVKLRLGGSGNVPKLAVRAEYAEHGDRARRMGHGGGDFWVLYYFARQILFGETAPFDIYAAADVTIPGILTYKSAVNNGQPYDVPDFREKRVRDKYRRDTFACPRIDHVNAMFPKNADKKIVGEFTSIMAELLHRAPQCRAVADWATLSHVVKDRRPLRAFVGDVLEALPVIRAAFKRAAGIADAYPKSQGARVIRELLELADSRTVASRNYGTKLQELKRKLAR